MRLVVIGGVAAGLSAAARARRADPSLEILVLEKTDSISYSACGLPYFIEGRVQPLNRLVRYTAEKFARERGVNVRTGAEVAAIEHARRQVALAGGERIHYDKLVIATGARIDRSVLGGSDQPHVLALHTLADASRMDAFLRDRPLKQATIVGGGYIGIESAEALRARGLAVEMFESSAHLLGRDDAALTDLLVKHLATFGVTVRLNTRLKQAPDEGLVLLAAGYRPNVELATEAGVQLGATGAIEVTDRMETTLGGIFAAGDCAESRHLVTGRPTWIPLGTTANKMGRVAGANAAGQRDRFPGIVGTSIVRVCGLGVGLTGLSEAQARHEGFDPRAAIVQSGDRAHYFHGRPVRVELVADKRTGRLLGGCIVGEHEVAGRVNVIATALHARMRVDEFEHLDLAYAPPFAPVWDPLLVAARQLMKQL
jgi:CoA-dependent NAD(P)H sulfur oxidoreductase